MDSETAAAAAAAAAASQISQSKENGGWGVESETPVGGAPAFVPDDDYETASEPEDSDVKGSVAADGEKGGNPTTRVLSKKSPSLDGGSEEEKGVATECSAVGDERVEKGEGLGGGSIIEDEKDELLGGGSKEAAPDSAVGVEGESKEEGKGEGFAGDENSLEHSEIGEKLEEKDEGNGESEVVAAASPLPVEEEETPIQEAEKETELNDVGQAETERDVAVDIVGSDENLEDVTGEDSKPVEVELNAVAEASKLDNVEEPKETNADVVSGKEGEKGDKGTGAVMAKETGANADVVDESTEWAAVEEDGKGTGVVVAEETGPNDEATQLKAVAEDTGVVVAEETGPNDEATQLKAVAEDTGAVSQRSLELETVEEKPVFNSDRVLTDLEAKPSDDDGDMNPHHDVEVEPAPCPVEDSKSKETETEHMETSGVMEGGTSREISVESMLPASVEKVEPVAEGSQVADDDENPAQNETEEEEEEDSVSDQQPRVAILDSSETAKQIIKEMDKGSSSASFESSRSLQPTVDGQIVLDSDEEVDTDEEVDGKEELFDSAALAALLKAATGGSSDGSITLTSQDGTRVFSVDRPAGLGSSAPALRPAPSRAAVRPTLFNPSELAVTAEPENEMDEEERKLHEKVEAIRVKFLRLVMRLGHTSEDTVAAQVLYRLSLAEGIRRGRQMGRAFSIESAKKKAIQLEEKGEEDLNFSCNILVLGKTGVGKSATINSIFGEEKSHINAFQAATSSVREISGVVDGVKIRVIDTPGLKLSVMDQAANRRILSSIKKYTKKCPPDIVLYVDRLDTQTRDFNDLPLLRSITSALGSSIWFNAIVALTHAASAPPEGPSGPLSYEVFIAQRSHVVQHSIRQAAGDMRLMNPVALVENHPSCRRNREGQRVLPNGISWRPQLLLLCYSSKILSEANTLLKLQDPSPGKLFGFRLRSPPLPYLLSTLLQSRPHPKLSSDQGGDNGDSDIDLDDFSDAEDEGEDEYDQLPPFKPLKKSQLAMLTKEQKRAYFDEYDYRVKLLQKKQLKEEIRRLKEMKKRGKSGRDDAPYGDMGEDFDQDGAPAAVPVPLPDMVLPPSFDCDVPTYRYRFLEPTSQLLTRPVLDTHGWDHDCGYDGVSLEETLAIANRFPASVAVQITKDKKDFSIHLDSSVAAKHGENGSTLVGFDIQSIGKQLAYILRHETKFKNLKKNKTAAGISVTFLGDTVATGLKVEDQLIIGKRLGLVASTGAIKAQGDVAYGANLEARLREKDYPIGQALSTLGLSLMKWRGDLALGANLQSQVNIGRNSKVAVRVGLNNKLSGQITVRTSTSEQLQLALVGILPVALSIMRSIWPGESEYSR